MARKEKNIQAESFLIAGARPDVLIYRQQVGIFRAYDDPNRIIKVGVPGQSDAGMIVAVQITPEMVGKTVGVAVQPEFKTSKGRQRERQEWWEAAVKQRGGVYALIRDPSEMLELIKRVQNGEW